VPLEVGGKVTDKPRFIALDPELLEAALGTATK
jgi:hypothetical protein